MKEKILISACLLGENCKYDGGNNLRSISSFKIARLAEIYDLIAVCPEVLGRLDIPREPAEILNGRVITKDSHLDVTENFNLGAEICAEIALKQSCKKAILKERSPSCGSGEIYDGSFTKSIIKGDGVTAKKLRRIGVKIFGESRMDALMGEYYV
ncbi:MAG: DUF523 domain-containing protein [Campylobacter sp.]|nr:DUF523 domain-containing protein [Campylobacter sp.]